VAMAHENTAECELTQNRGESTSATDATPRPRELSDSARDPAAIAMDVAAANDLVQRVAVAMEVREPLPPGLVMAWTHRGAEAWAACESVWAMRGLLRVINDRGWAWAQAWEYTRRHIERGEHGGETYYPERRCCADVVRSVAPCPTAEQLAMWGRR
jgi:hypothetical protein